MAEEKRNKYPEKYFDTLIKQIDAERTIAYKNQSSRIKTILNRLKLYNNQRRNKTAVGDVTLFSTIQTLLAVFYRDELSVSFRPREEGDADIGESLDKLAEYDYKLMKKDQLDYFWLWDTLFFGRGLILEMEFDRSPRLMCPIPVNIDAATFLRDPRAKSVNGDVKGNGRMRFGGDEIEIPKGDILEENGFFNIEGLKAVKEIESLLTQAKQERESAAGQGIDKFEGENEDLGENQMIPVLRWFTHWKPPGSNKVKKVMAILGNNRSKVIKYVEFNDEFPLIDRPLYPTSHQWDATSVPDLVEDKQRQKSVAVNLTLQAMKADLYPMYLYDEDRIKNKGDLTNFAFNKFIGVDGQGDIRGAVQPMNKATPRLDLTSFILNTLDTSAQIATATPEMQQGQISRQERTLGELNLVASKVDTRFSLTTKVFSWSEEAFWRQWYRLYKKHFKAGIDEKVIRIVGTFGDRWRPLTRENIIARIDPDIVIESKELSEAKNLRDRITLQNYGTLLLSDPTLEGNARYFMRKLGRLNNLTKDEVERILPPTFDELEAEEENELLNDDKLVEVSPTDNHVVHFEIHSKAADTPAKLAHLKAHRLAYKIRKEQPDLFPGLPVPGQPQENGITPQNIGMKIPTPSTPSQVAKQV